MAWILGAAIVLFIVAGLAAVAWALVKWDEQKHIHQGYWVEYISPGRLRGNEDDFVVVYHELERWQFFYGRTARWGEADRLSFPDEAAWQAQSPDWLNAKRALVLQRIHSDLKRIEIVTVPEFPPS